jgi:hypothetical protein
MANFKRTKTKRRVRCTICTKYRWMGNAKGRHRKSGRRPNSRESAVNE